MPTTKRLNLVHEGLKAVSVFVWEVNTDIPPVSREGNQYKFNNKLVAKLTFNDVDYLLDKLGG